MTPTVLASADSINLFNLPHCRTTQDTSVFFSFRDLKKDTGGKKKKRKRQRTEGGNPVFYDLRHVNRRDG